MSLFSGLTVSPSLNPLDSVKWVRRDVRIIDPSGQVVFEQLGVEVPEFWDELSVRVAVHKYFYGNLGTPERETSIRQLIERVARRISDWGFHQGYFITVDERENFYSDLSYILITQKAAFNSPVWFNVGTPDPEQQCSACFISSVEDTLESIEGLFTTEMEVFRRGSGNGVNMSHIRGSAEQLGKGGQASGPIPFMKALDFACGAMKSGGRARRGALMRILDIDHPDIIDFIGLKEHAEKVAHTLIEAGFSSDWDTGIYKDVPWQNANNSVRIPDAFMDAVADGEDWALIGRKSGQEVMRLDARELMKRLAGSAWTNGCPGVQFHDIINEWHTCPEDGEIRGSNPCSEYMFLDDTSCNLSSINLVTLLHRQGEKLVFDYKMFERVIRIMITAMDIVIDEAHYPNERLTIQTRKFRTLGLGYANLGALLMRSGIAYDSDSGRDTAAAITAYMQAVAYHQSSEVAAAMGAFDRYAANAQHVRKVIAMHCSALDKVGNRTGEYGLMLLEAERLFNATYDKPVRNAQVTVLAPTGTIGLFMGCDTTGVEPDLALVKYKQIHGTKGSVEKIVNQSVEPALIHLGYSLREIDEIQEYILQHGNIAKCEAVAESHKAVFDTALGAERTISWKGHVLMMAAVQPFLSGAISKTINMPNSSTVDDVQGAYELAHSLGLKSMAIYRDGSKGSQPVNTSDKTATATTSTSTPLRKKLPQVCKGDRVKFALAGIEVYIHTGCFEDGTLGELFITASKSGSTLQGLLNSTAIGISVGLQYGVPLSTYVELLRHQKFEPAGPVKLPGLERTHFYSSILDCIAHWLEVTYLKIPVESTSSDNPFCSDCGTLMVRSGTCFKCGQCGTTTGCS